MIHRRFVDMCMGLFRGARALPGVCLGLICIAACGGGSGGSDTQGGVPDAAMSLSQYGITWYFEAESEYGRFANGDYWVVGPVAIVAIDPPSAERNGRTMNGAMVNPSPTDGQIQGYDSAMYGDYGPAYSADRNAALGLSADRPLVLAPGNSLVSTISESEAGARPQLRTAAILTVLAAPPPTGSFRPPYSGIDKTIRFNTGDLASNRLAALAQVPATPDLTEVERFFERPWLDHVPGWTSRYTHPSENMPDYGREMADQVGVGALMLHLDFTDVQKQTLLVRYVQLGIDLHGVAVNGGEANWTPNGGHASGRKWPILFAGLMLGDDAMMGIGAGQVEFGEDGQTFYVSQADIDMTHDPDTRSSPAVEYEQSDLGMPEWGIRHATQPEADNNHWETVYRQCCTAVAWNGFVLAAHVMEAKALWNHDALFDYQDRYMQVTSPAGAYPGWRSWDAFTEQMWDAYRADYGGVWNP